MLPPQATTSLTLKSETSYFNACTRAQISRRPRLPVLSKHVELLHGTGLNSQIIPGQPFQLQLQPTLTVS